MSSSQWQTTFNTLWCVFSSCSNEVVLHAKRWLLIFYCNISEIRLKYFQTSKSIMYCLGTVFDISTISIFQPELGFVARFVKDTLINWQQLWHRESLATPIRCVFDIPGLQSGLFLLTWINFNPSMGNKNYVPNIARDKICYPVYKCQW